MAIASVCNCGYSSLLCSPSSSDQRGIHRHALFSTAAAAAISRPRTLAAVRAQRASWLPGLDPPPHLDGTLAGDFGFDPLGLGEDPESLRWYVQAELVHARFAMAGVAGVLFTDLLLRPTGVSDLPVWYEAGATKFDFASTRTLFIFQLILMGFVETKRYMDFISPCSQAKGSFFGLEAAFEGLAPGYPEGPLLNPLGLAKDIDEAHELKLKEIKNGRLAMVAMLGIFVQASLTHTGPVDNLVVHLSDPWHTTVVQTLSSMRS